MIEKLKISIITPCFNEEMVIIPFLRELGRVIGQQPGYEFNVVVVDDASYDNTVSKLENFSFDHPRINLHLIKNKFNVGHQKSIYHGILFSAELHQDKVIVMDSDGEDDPRAIPLLLEKIDFDIVEVKRGKRKESLAFKILYYFYKVIFRLLTGKALNYGNYCLLSMGVVEKLRYTSFIHFPAYLLKQKGSRTFVRFDRGSRIDGKSKMGYKNLLIHAFKSFVEFGDDLLLWLLRIFGVVLLFLFAILLNLLYQKFIAHTAIPGWFSTIFIGLLNLAMICLGFFVIGILIIHQAQSTSGKPGEIFNRIKSNQK